MRKKSFSHFQWEKDAEGNPIMQDLKAAWVVIATMCPFNFPA